MGRAGLRRRLRLLAIGAALGVGQSACSDRAPAPPAPSAAIAAGHGMFGTIVAVRPVPSPGARRPVLAAAGAGVSAAGASGSGTSGSGTSGSGTSGAGASGAGGPASEIVLRDDTGRTVSVVQDNREGLRTGDMVQLTGHGHTRLVRWNGAAAGA